MRGWQAFADRTAVLFLGIAAGAAIGYAFAAGEEKPAATPAAPAHAAASPPTAAPAAPDIALECALPFQSHLLEAIATGAPVTVGVFGDSFGDGVWSALYRLLPAKEKFRVLKYSQQSTGFTRYASLNLEEHAAKQIDADGPVDVAVISFGANDTQGVYAGGHAAALMSPAWQRVIGDRIAGFVRLMRARGAIVYWVGLPKMRAARFDADIAAMNAFYRQQMAALRVPFIDIAPMTVDAAGDYAAYLPDPASGETRLMRANDGVHMSMNGYVVITRGLAGRIKAYVAAARVMAAGGEAPVPPPVAPPAPPVLIPPPAVEPKPVEEPKKAEKPKPSGGEPKPAEVKPEPDKPKPAKPKVEPKPEPPRSEEPEPRPPLKLNLPPSDAPPPPDAP